MCLSVPVYIHLWPLQYDLLCFQIETVARGYARRTVRLNLRTFGHSSNFNALVGSRNPNFGALASRSFKHCFLDRNLRFSPWSGPKTQFSNKIHGVNRSLRGKTKLDPSQSQEWKENFEATFVRNQFHYTTFYRCRFDVYLHEISSWTDLKKSHRTHIIHPNILLGSFLVQPSSHVDFVHHYSSFCISATKSHERSNYKIWCPFQIWHSATHTLFAYDFSVEFCEICLRVAFWVARFAREYSWRSNLATVNHIWLLIGDFCAEHTLVGLCTHALTLSTPYEKFTLKWPRKTK